MAGLRGRTTAVAVTVVLVAVQVAAVWSIARGDARPHDVPVAVAGPDEIAGLVAAQSDGSTPLDLTAAGSAAAARDEVRDGRAAAALLIDLRTNRSTLVLSRAGGSALDDVLEREVGAVAQRYTSRLTIDRLGDASRTPPRWVAYAVALGSVALGWVIAVAITLRRGPVDETLAQGFSRNVLAVAWSTVLGLAVLGLGLATGAQPLLLGVVAGATAYTAAITTVALQSLYGVRGIALATVLFVLSAGPLVTGVDPSLLPTPWDAVTPWTLHGAALQAVVSVLLDQPARLPRAVAVLVMWILGALLVNVLARRARRAAGVTLT